MAAVAVWPSRSKSNGAVASVMPSCVTLPLRCSTSTDDPNSEGVVIQSVTDRLDRQSITLGVTVLIVYAGLAAFLCSPHVRRYIRG